MEIRRCVHDTKKYLLLLAGLVWGAAGFNILRLGLLAYVGLVKPLYLLLSAAVFVIFQKMVFGKLVQKHTARILAYEAPKVCFWHFSTGNLSSSWPL